MMRRMFEGIETEFIWWFDDDSFITEPDAPTLWLEAARKSPDSTAAWGQLAHCEHARDFTELANPAAFVRTASWYRGLPPPSWRPGGKGEFNFQGRGTGDGRWFFLTGGCWMVRSSAIKKLDWPDRRLKKMGDDVFLGEALRQNGWGLERVRPLGVAINAELRRGDPGLMSLPGADLVPAAGIHSTVMANTNGALAVFAETKSIAKTSTSGLGFS